MFDANHYVPVLKGKRGEFPAFQRLKDKTRLTPLFEHVPSQASADYIPSKMESVWPASQPYFIDMVYADDEDWPEDNAEQHPLSLAFSRATNQHAIPVTGPTRSQGYQAATRHIVASQGKGYAIRLGIEDLDDEETMTRWLDSIVDFLDVDRSEVDILLDLDTTAGQSAAVVTRTCITLVSMFPYLTEWRTLTVLMGGFPAGLSPLTRGWNLLPRSDWQGWLGLVTRPRGLARLPTYGDYTIANPDLPPTGLATILAQIRYTTPTDFLVYKGHNARTYGYDQFFDICAELVQRPEYSGADFSYGDQQIAAKAAREGSCGNAETWRQIGVNHHVEMVLDQLANRRGV